MMLDTKNRISAFISIPKNASKTVLEILDIGKNRDIDTTGSPIIYENHQRGCVLSLRYCLDDLFVFTFSRNPYDRCVSWYEYHKSIPPYKDMSFGEWVKSGMPHHWKKQNLTNYSIESISPLLQYNFVNECKIDFIGRIENFPQDIHRVLDVLNEVAIEKRIKKRFIWQDCWINRSQRQIDTGHYYTSETREIVYSLLEKDFQYFGYVK
jgi:hypothetical protein